jgi:phospholipid/cholesterol/gamma-HCH transport system substrate-binding protein
LFLVLLLYMIGKNQDLFGDTYQLKARFENIQGLVAGNNVRFSGIHAGTVKKVKILSDTVIEVTMIIDTKMQNIIRQNAIVSIGTDGLVGNKVVNITPAHQPAPLATEGDVLVSKKGVDTDEMLQTLYRTNNDIAVISAELKTTIQRVNSSSALWTLLNDQSIPKDVKAAAANIRLATAKAGGTINDLNNIVADIKNGKGTAGIILKDSSIAQNLNEAILKIKSVGDEADALAATVNKLLAGIQQDVNSGKGTVNTLLKDSLLSHHISQSLENIQKGTDGFNQVMEALKHNFLLRGYFKKQERKKP